MKIIKHIIHFPYEIEYVALCIILIVLSLVFIPVHNVSIQPQKSARLNIAYVSSNKIINPATGKPFILRGFEIPSELATSWHGGSEAKKVLNPAVFNAVHRWGANTVRIPVSADSYQLPDYMPFVDKVVFQARHEGLYVILSNVENPKIPGGGIVLDQKGLEFWKFIARHYTNNEAVMFDLINNPQNSSYAQWLNGGGGAIGLQEVTNAIRFAGGKQIIIAQGLSIDSLGFDSFKNFIHDPNIVYSLPVRFSTIPMRSASFWDSAFGNLARSYPILISDWAVMPNAPVAAYCQGLDPSTGTKLTNDFMNYTGSHNINWTASAFTPSQLILDEKNFTPTSLDDIWCCGKGNVCNGGMGQLVKNYLSNASNNLATSDLSPSAEGRSGKAVLGVSTPQTKLELIVCPVGIGTCNSKYIPGNPTPQHPLRAVTLTLYEPTNKPVATASGHLAYNETLGNFQGAVLFENVASGVYRVQMEIDGFLPKTLPGYQRITRGETVLLPEISGLTANIANSQSFDVSDYNNMLSCEMHENDDSCHFVSADLNDDGLVNAADVQLFLYELATQKATGNVSL